MSASSVRTSFTQRLPQVTILGPRPNDFERPANDCAPAATTDRRVEGLYRAHRSAIAARCRRLLRDCQAAEDATQETFMRVARSSGKVPSGNDALLWIYRIATNYCLNVLRDQKRAAQVGLEGLSLQASSSDTLPEPGVVDRDLLRRIFAAVPAKTRPVAVLLHVDGLHEDEVAYVLGVSRRTVTARLGEFRRRARAVANRD